MAAGRLHYPAGFAGAQPEVRRIGLSDVTDALAKGFADFMAMPTHLAFVCLIYPILGLFFASLAFGYDVLPLVYPLISGFALVGPFAGIGLYELSRRREAGQEVHWSDAFEVLRSPSIGSILAMGVILVVVFLCWMLTAQAVWSAIMGPIQPTSLGELVREVVATNRGWTLVLVGNAVGFLFAALVLAISVVAFPAILDRGIGTAAAIQTSIEAVTRNPVPMAAWGLIVAVMLALGSIPLFVGLAIVMPILGHATWHLYRAVVVS